MKLEKTSLKIFLTSGVTLTVSEDEKVMDMDEKEMDLFALSELIEDALENKSTLEFVAVINHPYVDEEDKEQNQEVKHYYNIPSERISWFMIEEV